MLNEQSKYARYVLLNSYCSQEQCQQYALLAFGSSQQPLWSKSQTQSSKSRAEKSDDSIHTELFTNALGLSCAEHPTIKKKPKCSKG